MNTYRARVEIEVEIEAPNEEDASELIEDTFGLGDLGEGVRVVNYDYQPIVD